MNVINLIQCTLYIQLNSGLITGFVSRLTRRVSLVEQELFTLLEHLSSPPVCSGVRVSRSLVLCVCIVDRCLSFCTFSFGHCGVCSSSIYGFWLPLWFLQTLLSYTEILPETVCIKCTSKMLVFYMYIHVQISCFITVQPHNTTVCQSLAAGRWFSPSTPI